MNSDFWRGKRVLLTGHTGFKGAWATLWLKSLGAHVTGFSLPPNSIPNIFDLGRVSDGIVSIIGDLRDARAVDKAVTEAAPDVVFHMAAQSLVRRSYADPVGTYETNIIGTVNLLDALRRLSDARGIINVTSDKCYENRETIWAYRETDPLGGHDPYSSSKACAEIVAAAYSKSFLSTRGMGLASARAGNVIGGGDWSEDRILADLMRGFAAGSSVVIRNPSAIRPWQHVLEAISGYFTLAERLFDNPMQYAGGWNFGPSGEDNVTVGRLANQLARLWGPGASCSSAPQSGPHEAHLLRLDATKARVLLGWRPKLDLDSALCWIVDWHRAHLDGRNMRDVTFGQIERYQTMRGAL